MITSTPTEITILVVDDEEDVVEIVSHFLKQEGYTVLAAYDGEEAIRKASPDVDLIVLDIMLPQIDGLEVCRRLRSRVETEMIPIIFLSAKAEEEDQVKGLMLGADDYLTKPVAPEVLMAHIKAVLRRAGVEESRVMKVGDLTIFEDEFSFSLNFGDASVSGLIPSLGDWNGDGVQDLYVPRSDDEIGFRLGSKTEGEPLFGRTKHGQPVPLQSGESRVADLNGDGLDEIVAFTDTDPDQPLVVLQNLGRLPGTRLELRSVPD